MSALLRLRRFARCREQPRHFVRLVSPEAAFGGDAEILHIGCRRGDALGVAAVAVHEALGLRHISRVDMIVRDGVPVFFEGNVAPGMTETSLAPLAIEASGRELGEVFAALVDLAGS